MRKACSLFLFCDVLFVEQGRACVHDFRELEGALNSKWCSIKCVWQLQLCFMHLYLSEIYVINNANRGEFLENCHPSCLTTERLHFIVVCWANNLRIQSNIKKFVMPCNCQISAMLICWKCITLILGNHFYCGIYYLIHLAFIYILVASSTYCFMHNETISLFLFKLSFLILL